MDPKFFDKDYFERGTVSKKSCYTNYRWIPELTIPLAYNLIKNLKIKENDKIIDFGCSKGYLVKALRLLNIEAYGLDISEYAISQVDPDTKKFCKLIDKENYAPFNLHFDWVISKDVMEHMTLDAIKLFLNTFAKNSSKMFHVIPLGDDKKFRIGDMHLDKSHIQIHDEDWWEDIFLQSGWKLLNLSYEMKGVKDNWSEYHPKGNGFFTLGKK